VIRDAAWTAEQLGRWLTLAITDRYDGLWVLAATTGMRRSELAGVGRSLLDPSAGTLILEDTRVVVDGRHEDSDGKSAAGRRAIALDPAMDAGVNPKLLSDRIGHANELVTLQIYTHRTTGLDRPMAEQLSRLIEGAVEAASQAGQAS